MYSMLRASAAVLSVGLVAIGLVALLTSHPAHQELNFDMDLEYQHGLGGLYAERRKPGVYDEDLATLEALEAAGSGSGSDPFRPREKGVNGCVGDAAKVPLHGCYNHTADVDIILPPPASLLFPPSAAKAATDESTMQQLAEDGWYDGWAKDKTDTSATQRLVEADDGWTLHESAAQEVLAAAPSEAAAAAPLEELAPAPAPLEQGKMRYAPPLDSAAATAKEPPSSANVLPQDNCEGRRQLGCFNHTADIDEIMAPYNG